MILICVGLVMFLLGLMNVFVMSNATKFHDDHAFYYDEEDE